MLKTTNYNGLREAGKSYGDIPSDVAKRWLAIGIAKADIAEPETPEIDYNLMSAKELFEVCKEKGIELEKEQINGKKEAEKKAYLLTKLSESMTE